MKDSITLFISKKLKVSQRSIERILYNAIPAFIFAPILLYYGYTFSAWPLLLIGTLLLVTDTYHFFR